MSKKLKEKKPAHLRGHYTLAEMINSHIDHWYEGFLSLKFVSRHDSGHAQFYAAELSAILDIKDAIAVEMGKALPERDSQSLYDQRRGQPDPIREKASGRARD